jgi:transmembrane sensor
MNELELLGNALREELGVPPDAWLKAQRVRLMERLAERHPVTERYRLVWIFAGVVALASAFAWVVPRARTEHVVRSLVAAEMREPFRFEDGSVLSLASGARGQLRVDDAFVRFELESGRAHFDVTPGQRRTWVITAGDNEVRVVGTRFSVSYAPSKAFDVEVERGVVSVRMPERKTSVELKAGDRLHQRPGRVEVGTQAPHASSVPSGGDETTNSAPEPSDSTESSARLGTRSESTHNEPWRDRYRDGSYAESLALIRANGLASRLNELDAATLAEVADAARLGGDPELAVRALTTLTRRFPGAAEARDGRFLLGRVHALRGDSNAAISAFESYLKPGGSTRYASDAVGRLIGLYAARGDRERARAMATRYLKDAPDGPYRRLASSLVR